MRVVKRDGRLEDVSFDKVLNRIKLLCDNLNIDPTVVAQKVNNFIHDKIKTSELDEVAARTAIGMSTVHPDYQILASKIIISNHHKRTLGDFSKNMETLYKNRDIHNKLTPIISKKLYNFVKKHENKINKEISYERDYLLDYFGFKTLEKAYLLRIRKKDEIKIIERPQDMFMRVSLGLHLDNLEEAFKSYHLMSNKYFTHASPTLFNAGTPRSQLFSCFVENTKVFTLNDGVKNIQDVKIGDTVVSHTGNERKVVQLHKNLLGERKLFDIKCFMSTPLTVTGNHRFWSISREQIKWGDITPRWNRIDYLRKSDYIALPNFEGKNGGFLDIYSYVSEESDVKYDVTESTITRIKVNDFTPRGASKSVKVEIKNNPINRVWPINNKFAKFIGIWLGDGHIQHIKKTHPVGIGITLHSENHELIDFVKIIGEELFGLEPSTHKQKNQKSISIYFNSVTLGNIFKTLFGKGFNGKFLPKFIYKWDKSLIKSLFSGLVCSDGCVAKSGGITLTMSNQKIMRELYHLGRRANMLISLSECTKLKKMGTKLSSTIGFPVGSDFVLNVSKQYKDDRINVCLNKKQHKGVKIVVNGQIFVSLIKKEPSKLKSEYVYTLGIEKDHSYSVEGLLAENCFLLGTSDSINGIYKTISDCAKISKWSGGIGVHISNVRGKNSLIRGTNGKTDGIIPMLKVYNETAKYVNQCFAPDTIVFSKDGFKRVENITDKDELITKDGSFQKVNKVFKSLKNENILEIRTKYSIFPVKCTKVHDFYVLQDQRKTLNHKVIKNRLSKNIVKPKFIPASEIKENDFLVFPIPTYEQDKPYNYDFCKMYGLMLGDGHICKKRNECGISLNVTSKKNEIQFVKDLLDKNDIHYWTTVDENCYNIRWTYNENLPIPYDMLYDENHDKKLNAEFLHLPKNKLLGLIEGLIKSDGSVLKEIMFTSTSLNLVESLRYCLLRLGILTSGYVKNNVGKSYCLRIPKHEKLSKILNFKSTYRYGFFEHNGMLFSRVRNVKEIPYNGYVYDFNMNNNHNYLTDSGLVHNSGKRNGSFAIYLEPHHPDIMEFLELKKNHGDENQRARDLFYAMWISDLFMKRVKNDETWSLFDPDECPGLEISYGKEYEKLYLKYENDKKFVRQVNARDIWKSIVTSQIETGVPYVSYKDHVNRKTNQQNLGTIRSSNLCNEINLYSDHKEYACCVLASLCLPRFVENGKFNHKKLIEVVKVIVNNLDKGIDINFYPVPETKKSNLAHRPLGIGVQGLADLYMKLKMPFDSKEAMKLNKEVFETMYYAALTASCELAKKNGPYSSFKGSPLSKGIFQFDMWNVKPSNRYDWDSLRKNIMKHGLRNSTLLALMPTASTSQIMGNFECFEAITSNIYVRRTLAGEFIVINNYLIRDLIKLGLWDDNMKDKLIYYDGSIQKIKEIPKQLKDIYKTVWEISQKNIIDQSADRGAFICQTQSMNLFLDKPSFNKVSSMHFYAWSKGLKTGMYYLRSKPAAAAQKFSLDPEKIKELSEQEKTEMIKVCSLKNKEACMMCSS